MEDVDEEEKTNVW